MAIFIVLWSYFLTTKLKCLQDKNIPPVLLLVLGMDQIMMNVRLLPWPDVKIFLNSRLMVLTDHPNAAGIYQSVIPKTHFLTCRDLYRQDNS